MKHYKTVMFVQISECQAPLHKCKAPLAYKKLSGNGSVATPSFSLTIYLITMVSFNTINELTFILSFINPTHCFPLTKPNYMAILVYKTKQTAFKTTHWLKMSFILK